jgi:hypothetical protein
MLSSGYWKTDVGQPATVPSCSNPAFNCLVVAASNGSAFTNAHDMAVSDAPFFQTDIENLSGSSINTSNCSSNCDKQVAQDANSALGGLWQSKANLLQTQWKLAVDPGGSQGSNAVGLYDSYNNSVVLDFQSSLNALEQGLQLETLTNQMNFVHAFSAPSLTNTCAANPPASCTSSGCTQIATWGGVPGTYFNVTQLGSSVTTESQALAAYNADQQQLESVYAARANQLVENALQVLVTDAPIAPQAFPTAPIPVTINGTTISLPPINYPAELGASLDKVPGGPARSPMLSLPQVAAGPWQAQGALYQYSALFDATKCAQSVQAFNNLYGTSGVPNGNLFNSTFPCPQLFPSGSTANMDGGYYDGDRIQPYYSTGSGIVLTGAMQANMRMCSPTSPSFDWYTPPSQNTGNAAGLTLGSWYLNCGNWNQITTIPITCFPYAHCPFNWSDAVASPQAWGQSQYYGTQSDYPDVGTHNHTLNDSNPNQDIYFFAAPNTGGYHASGGEPPLQMFSASVSGNLQFPTSLSAQTFTTPSGWLMAPTSPTSKQDTWWEGVISLPTTNQGSLTGGGHMGVFIPVGWTIYYAKRHTYRVGWEPEQGTTISQSGFTCTGWTCTTADGSEWNVANPSSSTSNTVDIELQQSS